MIAAITLNDVCFTIFYNSLIIIAFQILMTYAIVSHVNERIDEIKKDKKDKE